MEYSFHSIFPAKKLVQLPLKKPNIALLEQSVVYDYNEKNRPCWNWYLETVKLIALECKEL